MFWNKRPNLTRIKQTHETTGLKNPFRGKIGLAYLSAERESQVAEAVAELVLYDAQNVDSVRNFHVIKCSTECTFAKRSRIWGSPSYDDSLSLGKAVDLSLLVVNLGKAVYQISLEITKTK